MIPKVIHYCWFGRNPKPRSVKKCIKSWKKRCPGYEIIEWSEDNYDVSRNLYMKQAYDAKKWGFVPDFARLDIIYRYGGIYLDTDVELLKNIDRLLDDDFFCGFELNSKGATAALGLGFGAVKEHPLVRKLMSTYDTLHFIGQDGSLNLTPSPNYTSQTLVSCGFVLEDVTQRIGRDVVYASEVLSPLFFPTGEIVMTENTLSIHHYDASWFGKKQQQHKRKRWRRLRRNRFIKKIIGENHFNAVREKYLTIRRKIKKQVKPIGKPMMDTIRTIKRRFKMKG